MAGDVLRLEPMMRQSLATCGSRHATVVSWQRAVDVLRLSWSSYATEETRVVKTLSRSRCGGSLVVAFLLVVATSSMFARNQSNVRYQLAIDEEEEVIWGCEDFSRDTRSLLSGLLVEFYGGGAVKSLL